jgi:hypothetical protein
MPYRVFISYSTKDFSLVDYVRKLLRHSAIEVFVAEYSVPPGSLLSDTIITAIKNCNLFLLLWSKNSKYSEWVPQEIGIATSEGKPIVPIVIEPGLELPGFIKNRRYLAAYKDPDVALKWMRQNIFENARRKEQTDGLVWMGIAAAVLWLLGRK